MKHLKTSQELNESSENLNPSDVSLGQISINIPSGIKSHMDRLGIPQEYHSELFREYIDFLLGVNYGTEVDQFTRWTEQEDNIVDFRSSSKSFTITGKIESTFPNGQKTPDFHLSSPNKTLSGTPIEFDRSINKYSIPRQVEVTIIGTTKDGNNPKWNNPIYVSRIEDVIVNV